MARVKRAVNAHKKRRTVLKASKGYRGQRSRLYRKAKEQQLHSLNYAFRDRRARKGEFRKLWISRINAAARANDITYNRLIQGLKAAGVEVDRKNLADIAITDPAAFTALVDVARAALPEDVNAPAERPPNPGSGLRCSPNARPRWSRRSNCIVTSPGGAPDDFSPKVPTWLRPRRRAGWFAMSSSPSPRPQRYASFLASPVAGPPGDRTGRKSAVRHRDSGRAGRGVRDAGDPRWRMCWPVRRGWSRLPSRSASRATRAR